MSRWKILVNDGMEDSGLTALKNAGFEIDTNKVSQDELKIKLVEYQGIIVRSATKVRKEHIDYNPQLKFIARGGVGMDNIDVDYARSKGIQVINTPAASSRSVAELALAHILTLTRSLQLTNRKLIDGESFNALKKQLSSSTELKNKNLLLIGFGRIGYELAKIAIGLEMNVIVVDPYIQKAEVKLKFDTQEINCLLTMMDKKEALPLADYISLHTPFSGEPILSKEDFSLLKKNCILINTSRGENIDEMALLDALDQGQLFAAGLDVFQNEPNILTQLINHPKISISPHIAASTQEAQLRIADELVVRITSLYQSLRTNSIPG